MSRWLIALSLFIATTAHALPPGEHGRGFREGANHHLGDDSFVTAHGRAPTTADGEKARMHDHLVYVRGLLAASAATRPELAARRAELLGYLGEYIAAGITPRNTYVPWRSPVFIDATGNICAVGYLIERSAGRALPESIARAHRLDFLEDIAAAMPEVRAWVAASGFTLDELASIQPGYQGPAFSYDAGWVADQITDGAYRAEKDGVVTTGAFAKHQMTGAWTLIDADHKVLGKGTFRRGAGAWSSFDEKGTKVAEGPFLSSRPQGWWRFFHASGRVAAEGTFDKGLRHGAWAFYHDAAGATPIARGRFSRGLAVGPWYHYDEAGKLLATAGHSPRRATSDWLNDALVLTVTPGKDGVTHEMHGGIPAADYRLDGYYAGSERIYISQDGTSYDADGNQLASANGAWTTSDCHWSKARTRAAHAGDITTLHLSLLAGREEPGTAKPEVCDAPRPVPAARGRKLDAILASKTAVRAPVPAYVKDYDAVMTDYQDGDATNPTNHGDLASILANHMTWYMEWPHIDGMFIAVQATLPGFGANGN